ncbi:MAG: hypothetical protein F6K00_33705 [Leptolyngbya sp. SIOISBB]|nr:hypothetical protein [Leptolyngbya sp. SIOISBB]
MRPSDLSTEIGTVDQKTLDQFGAMLTTVLGDVLDGEGRFDLSDAAEPMLIANLRDVVGEVGELCEVFAGRALNQKQLRSLAELELAFAVLEDKAEGFMNLLSPRE